MSRKDTMCLTWSNVFTFTKLLEKEVKGTYDVVVAIARGGCIPGVILSHKFKADLQSITVSLYKDRKKQKLVFKSAVPKVFGKRVLIVDDIIDSGTTMAAVINRLKEEGTYDVKVAALIIRPDVEYPFEIDGYVLKENMWIHFPWEGED
jgi:hypoxanthine phosphoribosyltransferase